MNRPNEELMKAYGTEDVFLAKEASATPFAAKMLFAMMASQLSHHFADEFLAQRQQAMAMNDEFQAMHALRNEAMNQNARYTRPPVMIGPGISAGGMDPNMLYGIPLGLDQGMVRTAAVARGVGQDMAKMAIGLPLGGLAGKVMGSATGVLRKAPGAIAGAAKGALGSVAGKAALGVGALGVGGYMAGKKGLDYLSRENPQRAWGSTQFGAPALAYGVNEYGAPQRGAPFIQ